MTMTDQHNIQGHVDARRAAILRTAAAELYKLAKVAADEGADQGRIDNTAKLADELREKGSEYGVEDTRVALRLNRLAARVMTTRNAAQRAAILAQLKDAPDRVVEMYLELRDSRPDWTELEAARVAAYWPAVSPDHASSSWSIDEYEELARKLVAGEASVTA